MNYGRVLSGSHARGNTELKHFDLSFSSTAITATGNYINITGFLLGGSSAFTRVGNMVNFTKVEVRMLVTPGDPVNLYQSNLIVCPNGQQVAPVLSITTPPDDDAYTILSQRSFATGTSTRGAYALTMRHSFPGRGLCIHYDGVTSNMEIMNRIYWTIVCDSSVLPNPTYQGYVRVWYTDR